MDEASKENTAFIVENDIFEWHWLAFGLTNAPRTYQRIYYETCLALSNREYLFSLPKWYRRFLKSESWISNKCHPNYTMAYLLPKTNEAKHHLCKGPLDSLILPPVQHVLGWSSNLRPDLFSLLDGQSMRRMSRIHDAPERSPLKSACSDFGKDVQRALLLEKFNIRVQVRQFQLHFSTGPRTAASSRRQWPTAETTATLKQTATTGIRSHRQSEADGQFQHNFTSRRLPTMESTSSKKIPGNTSQNTTRFLELSRSLSNWPFNSSHYSASSLFALKCTWP